MLPIAKFDPPFEEFFATPQNNFAQLCATYNVEHELITLGAIERLNPLPENGIRVLELRTNERQMQSGGKIT